MSDENTSPVGISRRQLLKNGAAFALMAIPGVALIGCGTTTSSSTSSTAKSGGGSRSSTTGTTVVTIAASRGIVSAPIWNVANHAQRYGFTVKMSVLFTYSDQQKAVQQKQTFLATSGITNPAIIADQGVSNLRVIAGMVYGGQNLIMRKDVQVSSWKGLEGKTIGVTPGTYAEILFLICAQQHGANLNAIKLQNVSSGPTALDALRKKNIDGFVLFSPTIDQAVVEGVGYYPPGLDIGTSSLGSANGIIIANTDFLSNQTLAVNFLKAYVDSVHEMQQQNAFTRVATQLAGISSPVAQEAFQHLAFSELIDEQAIINAAKFGPRFGFAKTDTSSKVASLIDLGALSQATGKSVAALTQVPQKLRML